MRDCEIGGVWVSLSGGIGEGLGVGKSVRRGIYGIDFRSCVFRCITLTVSSKMEIFYNCKVRPIWRTVFYSDSLLIIKV